MTFMITRAFWLLSAVLNIILTAIGIIVPLMPASPFFILAIICTKKASPELYRRLIKTAGIMWLYKRIPILGKLL